MKKESYQNNLKLKRKTKKMKPLIIIKDVNRVGKSIFSDRIYQFISKQEVYIIMSKKSESKIYKIKPKDLDVIEELFIHTWCVLKPLLAYSNALNFAVCSYSIMAHQI
ncbi:MAG: hypothetical protein Nk1A_5000 [Endomicrobiia bacterium]|nr:MAG: hypothetical protein Nk1A_5000 [Endomicrobiia bacterium]